MRKDEPLAFYGGAAHNFGNEKPSSTLILLDLVLCERERAFL
jgi:hypothetical protein